MTKQERLMRLNGVRSIKKPASVPVNAQSLVEDDIGNKYRQEIQDGVLKLILVEKYTGELFE